MQIDSGMVFFQNKATGKIDVMVEGGIVKSNELETDILNQKFDKAYSVPTSGTRDSARKDNGWEYEAPLYGTDIGWTMNADFGVISSSFLGRVYYQMPNGKIQATIMNLTIWEEQQYNSADFGVETVFPKAVTGS